VSRWRSPSTPVTPAPSAARSACDDARRFLLIHTTHLDACTGQCQAFRCWHLELRCMPKSHRWWCLDSIHHRGCYRAEVSFYTRAYPFPLPLPIIMASFIWNELTDRLQHHPSSPRVERGMRIAHLHFLVVPDLCSHFLILYHVHAPIHDMPANIRRISFSCAFHLLLLQGSAHACTALEHVTCATKMGCQETLEHSTFHSLQMHAGGISKTCSGTLH
jgi:hypothetical protein